MTNKDRGIYLAANNTLLLFTVCSYIELLFLLLFRNLLSFELFVVFPLNIKSFTTVCSSQSKRARQHFDISSL
jgi:hypothetical protein